MSQTDKAIIVCIVKVLEEAWGPMSRANRMKVATPGVLHSEQKGPKGC